VLRPSVVLSPGFILESLAMVSNIRDIRRCQGIIIGSIAIIRSILVSLAIASSIKDI
jgi:hypothetical protein